MVNYLENRLQYADDRAIRAVFALCESAQAVEMTEELVGAVDEVHDHFGSMFEVGLEQEFREFVKKGSEHVYAQAEGRQFGSQKSHPSSIIGRT